MNYAMVFRLIRKEWHFSWIAIAFLLSAGFVMLIALWIASDTAPFLVRLVLSSLFYSVLNFMMWLPMATILSERTEQTLAFLVSLPITIKEYTAAKVAAGLATFVGAWLLLSAGIVSLNLVTAAAYIPLVIILLLQALVLFCLILAVALVSESGAWTSMAGIVSNIVFWFSFGLIGVIPGMGVSQDPEATWNAISWMVPAQLVAIPVILGLALFFQSLKTDFLR